MSATGEAGATLLEMLVVIGVMALIAALIYPAWIAPVQRTAFDGARATLAANLSGARSAALKGGAAQTVSIEDGGHSYQALGVRVTLPRQTTVSADPADIVFFPDGTASGGALRLANAKRATRLTVSEATGLVTDGAR